VTRTFLDSGVLIAAIRGTPEIADCALALLNDPERRFISSAFVQLEVLPKAVYFRQEVEASFYWAYFASVTAMVPVLPALVADALAQAQQTGLPPWTPCTSPRHEPARRQNSWRSNAPERICSAWKG
jgi:hypothetical protein